MTRMLPKVVVVSLFLLLNVVITYLAITRTRNNQFYSDTFWLLPLGIFVWGDALIIAPFWIFSASLFYFLSEIEILRFVLLFFIIRSAYEVVYWIVHQVMQRKYNPPLFRRITWLSPNDSAVLYQLLNSCWIVLFSFLLMQTFT